MSASGMAGRLNTTGDTTVSMQEDSDEHQEVIEVQILPQVRSFDNVASSIHSFLIISNKAFILPNFCFFLSKILKVLNHLM